jgi:antitoxin VapB
MEVVAKVFSTGHSQAVRLPKAFRLDVPEVWLSKDEVTGAITMRPKHDDQRNKNLAELFRLIREQPFSEDFIPPRDDEYRPSPFQDSEPLEPTKPAIVAKRRRGMGKAAA